MTTPVTPLARISSTSLLVCPAPVTSHAPAPPSLGHVPPRPRAPFRARPAHPPRSRPSDVHMRRPFPRPFPPPPENGPCQRRRTCSGPSRVAETHPRPGGPAHRRHTPWQRHACMCCSVATRKERLGKSDSERATRKGRSGTIDAEISIRKDSEGRLGKGDSERATRKGDSFPSRDSGRAGYRSRDALGARLASQGRTFTS